MLGDAPSRLISNPDPPVITPTTTREIFTNLRIFLDLLEILPKQRKYEILFIKIYICANQYDRCDKYIFNLYVDFKRKSILGEIPWWIWYFLQLTFLFLDVLESVILSCLLLCRSFYFMYEFF